MWAFFDTGYQLKSTLYMNTLPSNFEDLSRPELLRLCMALKTDTQPDPSMYTSQTLRELIQISLRCSKDIPLAAPSLRRQQGEDASGI